MYKIRAVMIEHRNYIKSYMMTDREVGIYELIAFHTDVTSVELSKILKIPVRTASDLLSGMMKKGWLVRMDAIAPSGGRMYLYRQAD